MAKPAPGKRKCNCKQKVVTRQLGAGVFQQYTQQECQECPNVKFERESETLSVSVEPGMVDGQVGSLPARASGMILCLRLTGGEEKHCHSLPRSFCEGVDSGHMRSSCQCMYLHAMAEFCAESVSGRFAGDCVL